MRLGWRYNGVAVGASFGFDLGSDAFLFVGFSDFGERDLRPHYLPPARVATVYHQTTIINNYTVVNNRVVHRGVPVERVSAASRGGVPRATVRDWSAAPGGTPSRATSVVYRSRPQAPARPVAMEAQRVDNQHPVIRHAPAASARPEQRAALERVGRSPGGKPAAASLQANAAPRTSRPEPSTQIQTTSRSPQKPAATTPQKPATASAVRPPPAAPERASVPTSPQRPPSVSAPKPARSAPSTARAAQPTDDWKQGTRAAPSYRSDAGLAAQFNTGQSSPAASPAPKPHVYYPKGYYQNSELSSSRPSASPAPSSASPRGNSPSAPGRNR